MYFDVGEWRKSSVRKPDAPKATLIFFALLEKWDRHTFLWWPLRGCSGFSLLFQMTNFRGP